MDETAIELIDLAEAAWGIIANVGGWAGGGWDAQGDEWKAAAERWRDRYHAALNAHLAARDA